MLPFLERTTRRQRVFKRVILGATLVVLASMIGASQSARYRLLLGAGQTRDVLARPWAVSLALKDDFSDLRLTQGSRRSGG